MALQHFDQIAAMDLRFARCPAQRGRKRRIVSLVGPPDDLAQGLTGKPATMPAMRRVVVPLLCGVGAVLAGLSLALARSLKDGDTLGNVVHRYFFAHRASARLSDRFQLGLWETVVLSGIDRQALRRGAKAPDFELPNPAGESVRLSRLLESGPVVVSTPVVMCDSG